MSMNIDAMTTTELMETSARLHLQRRGLDETIEELDTEIARRGGAGTTYFTTFAKFAMGKDTKDELDNSQLEAMDPEKYENAFQSTRADFALSITKAKKFYSGEEIAKATIKVPCKPRVTVTRI